MFTHIDDYCRALREGCLIHDLRDKRLAWGGSWDERDAYAKGLPLEGDYKHLSKDHDWLSRVGRGNLLSGLFNPVHSSKNLTFFVHAVKEWTEDWKKLSDGHRNECEDFSPFTYDDYWCSMKVESDISRVKTTLEEISKKLACGSFPVALSQCVSSLDSILSELRAEWKEVEDEVVADWERRREPERRAMLTCMTMEKDRLARRVFGRFIPWSFEPERIMRWDSHVGADGTVLQAVKAKFEDFEIVAGEVWVRCVVLLYGRDSCELDCEPLPRPLGRQVADGMLEGVSAVGIGLSRMRRDLEEQFESGLMALELMGEPAILNGGKGGNSKVMLITSPPYTRKGDWDLSFLPGIGKLLLDNVEVLRYQCGQMIAGTEKGIVSLGMIYAAMESVQRVCVYLNEYCESVEGCDCNQRCDVNVYVATSGVEIDLW